MSEILYPTKFVIEPGKFANEPAQCYNLVLRKEDDKYGKL